MSHYPEFADSETVMDQGMCAGICHHQASAR